MNLTTYAIKTREHSHKISCYETQLKVWGNNTGYALVLQHYPEKLKAELQNQWACEEIDNTRSFVSLLVLI